MSQINVMTSMQELAKSFRHTDRYVFPNDTNWFANYEKYVASEHDQLKIYHATASAGSESLLLPLVEKKTALGTVILESLQNYYTVDYRPICSSEFARSLITDSINCIVSHKAADQVSLMPLDTDAPEIILIERAFSTAGWNIKKNSYQINWVQSVHGTYNDYLNARPKRLRNTINRKTKRLLSMPDVDLTVHKGNSDLDDLISDYVSVYEKSWKNNEPHPDFIPTLIKTMAEQDYLRLGLLKIGSVPVAVHFWIVIDQQAYIYKLAHDSAYDRYSPGTVLMAEMVRYVIEKDGVHELDFMSGDDEYKKDWMDNRREKIVLNAYSNSSMRGLSKYYFECRLLPFLRQISNKFRLLLRRDSSKML